MSDMQWVRTIYGAKPNGTKWYHFIPDKGISKVVS